MKKLTLLFVLIVILTFAGCKEQKGAVTGKVHPQWSLNATIYELNTRQFTTEGTFAAAQTHLQRLKDLGVDIIWIMPIQEIGIQMRKGELGSYYAIKDYTKINPEFGAFEDFKRFVDRAHELGMKVILDWVANHTSPDATWVANRGWHLKDSLGRLIAPFDWTDVAELDYDNKDMRRAMVDAMIYWVNETGIDGFRCDVAQQVPTDFWNDAVAELQTIRPDIFMLAESEVPEHQQKAFDMYYGWELHHVMNKMAKGEFNTDSLRSYIKRHDVRFTEGFPMLFTSNHDENSWNGTEFERMGATAQQFAALTYVLPGMPMIYNGQEIGFDRRLAFFDKDSINWIPDNNYTAFYKSFNDLRDSSKALRSGSEGGNLIEVMNSEPSKVFSFIRSKDKSSVISVFNFTPQPVTVTMNDDAFNGEFTDLSTKDKVTLANGNTLPLESWGYKIFYK